MGGYVQNDSEEQREFVDTPNDMIQQWLISYKAGDSGMNRIRLADAGYAELNDGKHDKPFEGLILQDRGSNYIYLSSPSNL